MTDVYAFYLVNAADLKALPITSLFNEDGSPAHEFIPVDLQDIVDMDKLEGDFETMTLDGVLGVDKWLTSLGPDPSDPSTNLALLLLVSGSLEMIWGIEDQTWEGSTCEDTIFPLMEEPYKSMLREIREADQLVAFGGKDVLGFINALRNAFGKLEKLPVDGSSPVGVDEHEFMALTSEDERDGLVKSGYNLVTRLKDAIQKKFSDYLLVVHQ
nr:hypothetical protein [Candidatus Sigynarchaeota archaeon]